MEYYIYDKKTGTSLFHIIFYDKKVGLKFVKQLSKLKQFDIVKGI